MSSTPSSTIPPAMPNTPEMKDDRTMVAPMMASAAGVIEGRRLTASVARCPDRNTAPVQCCVAHPETLSGTRQRAVDHVDGVLQAVDRDERAEARAFLLAEQHLVQHVEPVERDARLAVLGLLFLIEERRTAANVVEHVLDLF